MKNGLLTHGTLDMNKTKIINTMRKILDDRHTNRFPGDVFADEVSIGNGLIDCVAVKKGQVPYIIGYELKSSREDFKSDQKWKKYLDHCNEFYFVAPKGVIDPDELDYGVGLYEFNTKYHSIRRKLKAEDTGILDTNQILWSICKKLGSEQAVIRSLKREVSDLKDDVRCLGRKQ